MEVEKARRTAQVYYDARNVFFRQAATAYSAGDGRLAADLSRKGREMGDKAKQHRDQANEAVSASLMMPDYGWLHAFWLHWNDGL